MKKQIAKTIFINSFQKEIRNKTFWVLLISSILVMFAGRAFFTKVIPTVIGEGGIQQFDMYFYYFIITIWSTLMMGLLGINCIKSDTRYGLSEQILAFPIRSEHYLLLRMLASSLMVWFFYLILFIMMAVFLIPSPQYPLGFSSLFAVVIFFASIFVVTNLATLWSLLLGQISGFIALFFSVVIITSINKGLNSFETLYYPALLLHWLLPHIGVIWQISHTLIFHTPLAPSLNLWIEIPHFFLSTGLLFWGTHFIFKKRGFK